MGASIGLRDFLWLFLGVKGRISRGPFLLGVLLLNLIIAFPVYRAILLPENHPDVAWWIGIASTLSFPALWSVLALSVKRVHDFGKPGPLGVLIIVPMINLLSLVAFSAIPGEPGPNRFGSRTNSAE